MKGEINGGRNSGNENSSLSTIGKKEKEGNEKFF